MLLDKLKGLHLHLKQANLVPQEKIDSWVENFKLIPNSKNLGWGQRICVCEYRAVFSIEDYRKAPELPLVLVSTWLLTNDKQRIEQDLPPPDVDIDMADESRADVTIEVMFREDVELIVDPAGYIAYADKKWSIASVDVSLAETGMLFANDDGSPVTEDDMPDGALVDEDDEYVLIVEGDD